LALGANLLAAAAAVVPIPGALSFDQACCLLGNYETAYHCLVTRGRLREGETVLIHGAAGATGLAAVEVAREAALARVGLAAPTVRVVAPVSPPFDADALLALPEFLHGAGARVLVLRGASGRDAWVDVLRTRGFVVDVVRAYRLEAAEPAAGEIDRLRAWVACDAPAAFAFSSVDAIDVTLRRLEAAGALDWAMRQRALVLHPRHAGHLAGLGWSRTVQVAPGEAALMQALESA